MIPGLETVAELQRFVEGGGGLLVTHDAVGMRAQPPIFPQVEVGLDRPVKETKVTVALDGPLTAGLSVGSTFDHAYYDHVPMQAGEGAQVAITDAAGNPVVVAAEVGEGRYVACGMAIGLQPGDGEAPPVGGELTLLCNIITWLAR